MNREEKEKISKNRLNPIGWHLPVVLIILF